MELTLIYIVAMFAIFYFLLIRPQQKKTKALKDMREGLSIGDKVVTIGGLNGTVVRMHEDDITIQVDEADHMLTFKKWAIGSVESAK